MRNLVLALVGLVAACGNDATTSGAPAATSIEIGGISNIDAVLAKHRGHGVLLNFWATWCLPCVEELPELLEIGHEFRDQGGDVVLVSYDLMVPDVTREQGHELVSKFATKRKITEPIVIYDAPDFDAINEHYELPGGVPVTIAFDRDGKIVDKQDGQAGKARFAEMMRKAIAK